MAGVRVDSSTGCGGMVSRSWSAALQSPSKSASRPHTASGTPCGVSTSACSGAVF